MIQFWSAVCVCVCTHFPLKAFITDRVWAVSCNMPPCFPFPQHVSGYSAMHHDIITTMLLGENSGPVLGEIATDRSPLVSCCIRSAQVKLQWCQPLRMKSVVLWRSEIIFPVLQSWVVWGTPLVVFRGMLLACRLAKPLTCMWICFFIVIIIF